MKPGEPRVRRCTAVVLATVGLLAACNSSSGKNAGEAASEITNESAAPGDTASAVSGPATGTGLGPGDFMLPDPAVGLAELSGYRASLKVSFDGTESGTPTQWSTSSELLRSAELSAAQVTIERSGDIEAATPTFMVEFGGTIYTRDASGNCEAHASGPEPSMVTVMEPARGVAGVMGAEPLGDKVVGGIDAAGYEFDERAVALEGVAATVGEVWVAVDGGYVVAYTMTSEGDDDYFGEGVDGTITWQYELSDVNAPLAIEVPDDCPPGVIGTSLPADASNVVNVPGLLRYDTSDSVADILASFDAQGADLGWTQIGDSFASESGGVVEYSDGTHGITILVRSGDAGSTVHGMIGELPTEPGGTGSTGAGASGEATFEMSGAHGASGTWEFVSEFSLLGGGMLTFHDPANPMPTGPFLTLVLAPGSENLSFSDGQITIIAGIDVCTFTIDRQDANGAAGNVECVGAQPGGVDISIMFDVTT